MQSPVRVAGGRRGLFSNTWKQTEIRTKYLADASLKRVGSTRLLVMSVLGCVFTGQRSSKGPFTHSMPFPCRAHTVPLPCRAAKGLECVFPI
jgi:hypothetical protein